ncbi:uncharacterized protein N7477_006179 [Penicillium maclennaniae]|uniref:uncharacterized protein n=1 Tax=Penicillium maclennaniae TaxID=1343394 RepID=UPI0025409532|nr:uncharacterized protein N7477_006179 [Penicillium maclennaniae]KAJ5670816.1 hypothetical protein N7477_006179 [Penicillium maclennaniae]
MRRHPQSALALWRSQSSPSIFRPISLRFQSSHDTPPHLGRTPRRQWQTREGQKHLLEVDSLGKPGEIVVVSDLPRGNVRNRQRKRNDAVEDVEQMTLSSMLDALDEEASDLTASAVNHAFETFRGTHRPNDPLTPVEWENLRSKLVTSFTYNQLSDYIVESRSKLSSTDESAGKWRPGTSLFLHAMPEETRDDVTDRVATSRDLKGKSLMAEKILRNCWQLSIVNEVGQLDLRLPSASAVLLLNAEHFSFDEVASLHGSSIDITSSLGLVRITGKKNSCESIREVILDATARIRDHDVDIEVDKATSARVFGSEFLEWVGKTYGVALEKGSSRVPTKILYLAENERGADEARRTLNLAIYENKPVQFPFSSYLPASEQASVYHINPGENVSWFDSQLSWFRWAMSSTQSAEAAPSSPIFDSHQSRLSNALLKLLRTGLPTKAQSQAGSHVHESVTAAAGRCLFARKASFEESVLTAPQLGALSLPRTFTTEIPRIAPFLESLPLQSKEAARKYDIRLTPSAHFADTIPPLDVEILVNVAEMAGVEDTIKVQSVKSVLSTNSVDYLLPENGLDLRFTHTVGRKVSNETLTGSSHYELLVKSITESLQGVFDSRNSSLGPVPLPPFCQISVPGDLQLSGDPISNDHITAEYLLPPLSDIEGAMTQSYDFDGRLLSYRFYESGPFLAARTTELFLNMELPDATSRLEPNQPQESVEDTFHAFYNAACKMAFKIHKAKFETAEAL